jgi:hypothetical protein
LGLYIGFALSYHDVCHRLHWEMVCEIDENVPKDSGSTVNR